METIAYFFSEKFWATWVAIVAMVLMITAAINNKLNVKKPWNQIIAWGVSAILTVGCYFLGLIHVAEPEWLSLIAVSLVSGLASNGVYDIPTIKSFVNNLFGKLKA